MSIVTFKIGCRDCMNMDSMEKLIQVEDEALNALFQDEEQTTLRSKNEIKNWLEEGLPYYGYDTCPFCGSSNLEIVNIEVDGEIVKNIPVVRFNCRCSKCDTTSMGISLQVDEEFLSQYRFAVRVFSDKSALLNSWLINWIEKSIKNSDSYTCSSCGATSCYFIHNAYVRTEIDE